MELKGQTIAMASDHAGYNLKQDVRAWLESQGAQVKDYGCYSTIPILPIRWLRLSIEANNPQASLSALRATASA